MDADAVVVGRRVARPSAIASRRWASSILGDGLPDDPQRPRRGHAPPRHAGRVLAHVRDRLHDDPAQPAFFRSADPTYAWGGPNVDQVARRATVDGAGTYRVSGRMGSCEEFVLQIKGGTTQSGGANIATEVYRVVARARPRRHVRDPCRAPRSSPAPWLPLGPGPGFVHVRDYYFDWVAGRAGHVRDRTTRHPGRPVGARSDRRARRRRCSTTAVARGRALARLLPRPAGAHARRAGPRTSSASPTSPAGACRTSSTATGSCSCATTRRWCSSSIRPPPRCGASARTRRRGTSRSTTRRA